jgi:hypothetical protein
MTPFVIFLVGLLLYHGAPFVLAGATVYTAVSWYRGKRRLRAPILVGLCAVASFFTGRQILVHQNAIKWWWMRPQLETIRRNAAPILDAIRRFEADERRAPSSFDELIPRYLAELPATGCGNAPVYYFGDNYSGTCGLYTWGLTEDIDDYFIYAPEHLQLEDEGPTTRVGDWIYFDG